ncbi:vacuolar protein sorting-associated protein 26-domain-containing protein [Pelagophyceae sp. CCMP2097]|nr:vacuolar protein sorting-associated protein 26-domain-containing protein [Pelagophyceae sp. CCMP2097]|mmetsp:Transcript_18563/g.63941  ORF Transcript_18563/g.63941 Transcript_18563/m.63941 type:complete len:307 (+) Transcript_18563:79-999(+)
MSDIEHSSLEVVLKRVDRIYRPGETVEGVVLVSAKGGWPHKGITMKVSGSARLQLSHRSLGLFESVSVSGIKPRDLVLKKIELAPPGRLPDGVTEIPFEFDVVGLNGAALHESYHGVYINVCYAIALECRRGFTKTPIEGEMEFIVEVPTNDAPPADPKTFEITPESLENVRAASVASIPRFHVSGRLHRSSCPINLPFTGEVVVEASEVVVRSIELQLVRSETIKHAESGGSAREATEIQNIQIADGDACRNLVIPIYMIFPRLFTCPTMVTDDFKIEFEVNLIVIFGDGYMVTENFPIKLHRCR